MAVQHSKNVQTAIVGTEITIATITDDGSYTITFNGVNMVGGDKVTYRVYKQTEDAGTYELYQSGSYAHNQSANNRISLPVPSTIGCRFTLEQTAGTARDFPWLIEQLDA